VGSDQDIYKFVKEVMDNMLDAFCIVLAVINKPVVEIPESLD
jgi:hypothetical protein